MKRVKWIALGIVALIVIAVAIVLLRLDAIVRSQIESQSSASLGLPTKLESARVSILGGSLQLTDFGVSSPQGFAAPEMLALGGAKVGVSVGNLRTDPIGIDRIVLDKPRLVIEQSQGKFNFQVLTGLQSKSPPDNSEPIKLIIHELAINDAQVVVRPGIPGLSQELTLPIPSFAVNDIGRGEGAKNGAAIREVVTLVVATLAQKASESDKLPADVRKLLSLNVDQMKQQVQGEINKQIDQAQQKIEKGIQKGIGDILISISHCRTYATAYAIALALPRAASTATKESAQE